ncbi:DUF2397 family protein [Streptomyces sp. NPDC001401]|uniref:DUF2397 family protein n=1 Tax=Streptomyces sp. NPDC001401 TaxID=3364570 RepID=UPI003693840E
MSERQTAEIRTFARMRCRGSAVGMLDQQRRLMRGPLRGDPSRESLGWICRGCCVSMWLSGMDMGLREDLLREDALELDQKMVQLFKWGTVESWQDRAELETDFLPNRERYQLTQPAAELHRFVVAQEQAQRDTSTSALLGPALIAKHVEEFCSAALARDHETADTAWAQVQLTLSDMQRAAHRWQSAMAHGLSGAPTADKIESLTTLLRNYVDVWGASVDLHTPAIGALALRVAELDADTWRE